MAAAALAAAYYSAVFARASFLFGQDTAASVPAAVALVPNNGSYVARLAAWKPKDKDALLERAVELNPFDYESWIQLGLGAEMQRHNLAAAERYYLQAAKVNHMFLPKWTLTNFYFRNEQAAPFFKWARAALQISPYQADPVFIQMWLMTQDPARIAAALPDKANVLLEYTAFLTHTGQFAPIPPVVARLVGMAGHGNPVSFGRDEVLSAEDRMLAAAHLQPALSVWRSMLEGGWIQLGLPSASSPLTNGDFAHPFLGHGFDWTITGASGVRVEQSPAERSVTLTLTGDEPEHCTLFEQYVPLEAGRTYRLQWEAEAPSHDEPVGIGWHVRSVQAGAVADLRGGDLLAERRGSWEFQAPHASDVCLLTLEYSRPLGRLQANGSFTLRSVSLQEK